MDSTQEYLTLKFRDLNPCGYIPSITLGCSYREQCRVFSETSSFICVSSFSAQAANNLRGGFSMSHERQQLSRYLAQYRGSVWIDPAIAWAEGIIDNDTLPMLVERILAKGEKLATLEPRRN
jgi:hypothetical protein